MTTYDSDSGDGGIFTRRNALLGIGAIIALLVLSGFYVIVNAGHVGVVKRCRLNNELGNDHNPIMREPAQDRDNCIDQL